MANPKNRVRLTIVGICALMALFLGFFISQHLYWKKGIETSKFHGTILEKPRDVAAFELTGIDNRPFNNDSLHGRWTIMFFGFTNCGSICPTTMAELGKMYRVLEEKDAKVLPQVVMVSLDPERDSADKLNHYVKVFDRHFYGARGEEDAVKLMAHEMGVAYAKIALQGNGDAENYEIEHTGTLMLFNPKGQLSAFFTMPHKAALLASDYLLLVS